MNLSISRLRSSLVVVAGLVLVASGCKKDAAELTADWNKHVDEVQKYSAKYPAFKPALDARLAEAQKIFEEAKAASGDSQAAKMTEANGRLKDCFGPFDAYEAAQKALKAAAEKHASLPPTLAKLSQMAKAAEAKASTTVGNAKPTNMGEAKVTLEEASTLLKDATEAFAASDGYVKASDELKALLADKDINNMPAGTVMPLMEGAKRGQVTSAGMITVANPANPSDVKVKITQATDVLVKATEPLAKLKPAPAAAAVKPGAPATKPGTPPPATKSGPPPAKSTAAPAKK